MRGKIIYQGFALFLILSCFVFNYTINIATIRLFKRTNINHGTIAYKLHWHGYVTY